MTEQEGAEPLAVAKLLKARGGRRKAPGLVILGKQAIDDDSATRPARCWPPCWAARKATFASEGRPVSTATRWTVTREVDGGLETVEPVPAGGGDGGPAAERAALRLPAQHHEGEAPSPWPDKSPPADLRRRYHPQRLTTLKVAEPPTRAARRGARTASTPWNWPIS